jgi:hypothetical protein
MDTITTVIAAAFLLTGVAAIAAAAWASLQRRQTRRLHARGL